MAGKHKKNYKISAEKPIGGTAIKQSLGSRIFDIFNICLFIFLALIILFPFWNIIAISLTGNAEYMASPSSFSRRSRLWRPINTFSPRPCSSVRLL